MYDFAVIETSSMELDDDSRSATCLPAPFRHVSANDGTSTEPKCFAAGWGALSTNGIYPFELRSVALNVFSYDYCLATSKYQPRDLEEPISFCAGYIDGHKDTCSADSGGPFVCIVNDVAVLYGLVSFGFDCAHPDYPGVYAKVSSQVNWIENVIRMLPRRSPI